MSKGIVYLVGAGPGDPGLVTLRARELIESADVLVHDCLAHPGLLKWRRADCEVHCVGEKPGPRALPQDRIEALLVGKAGEGKRVVRLNGGDPFVFDRGGEEARALAEHGIPFEVVPGVTAALAAGACAGIPLTHRDTGPAVVFLNGREDPRGKNSVDWRACAKLKNTTLAIYMGTARLAEILRELIAGGLAPGTPAAAVQWASLGRQRSVAGAAADLAERVARAGLSSPAIVFVGESVARRAAIDWFERLPLFGRRVAITRDRDRNSELRGRLEALGAEVVELPLITVTKDVDRLALVEILAGLGSYDWIVFTSANGARFFFEEFFKGFDDVRSLGLLRFACVGRATAREVERHHLKVECMPSAATGESLAGALIATGSLDNAKIIVATGSLNRDALVKKLEGARAIVDLLPLYKTEKTDLAGDPAADDFRRNGADAILFASSSAAQSFAGQAGALRTAPGARRPLAGSIGGRTSATMREAGIPVDFEAGTATLDALVEALIERLNGRGGV
ncbi:MAG: uroporphyrinogen-III C-methyltransferase [Opitutaceae bacterium]|jgi:uroporphyrinogen III methyltransferase/synthase|nr:uroporphyrinogen-III C-methyltransferase [Opitutaceae bacterium]